MSEKKLTLEDIIRWITENQDDTVAMDTINRVSYQSTSKFKARGEQFRQEMNGS